MPPIQDCQKDGKPGYMYGENNTCYIYNTDSEQSKKRAYDKAAKQGQAIESQRLRNKYKTTNKDEK